VQHRTAALRQLSLHVLKLQDIERRRVARELHDSVGQDFAGLSARPFRALVYGGDFRPMSHATGQRVGSAMHS